MPPYRFRAPDPADPLRHLAHLTDRGLAWCLGLAQALDTQLAPVRHAVGADRLAAARASWEHGDGAGGGFLLRTVGAMRTIDALHWGQSPPMLRHALWVALVGRAIASVADGEGAQSVLARLPGPDGDQAAFELVAAADLSVRLGGRVRFVAVERGRRTPDLEIGNATRGVAVECKRQDDASGAEVQRERISDHVVNSARRAVRATGIGASILVWTAEEPDEDARRGITRLVRDCLDDLVVSPALRGAERDANGGAVFVRVDRHVPTAPGELPVMRFDGAHDMAGAQTTMGLARDLGDTTPRYAVTTRLGPHLGPSGAEQRLNQARGQLPKSGPGVVALWLREERDEDRALVLARLQALLTPEKNRRISAVIAYAMTTDGVFDVPPSLARCLDVTVLRHMDPREPIRLADDATPAANGADG